MYRYMYIYLYIYIYIYRTEEGPSDRAVLLQDDLLALFDAPPPRPSAATGRKGGVAINLLDLLDPAPSTPHHPAPSAPSSRPTSHVASMGLEGGAWLARREGGGFLPGSDGGGHP